MKYIIPQFSLLFFLSTIGCFSPSEVTVELPKTINFEGKPKNIILMIGDGMGLSHISAHLYDNDLKSPFTYFTSIGFQKTYAADDLITDSAAAATAMAAGEKTYRNAIGVSRDTQIVQTILEEAESHNMATGIVVTSAITHATPAGFYAHQPLRNFTEYMAADFVDSGIDFAVGGGKQYFVNRATDKRNLLVELKLKGYNVTNFEDRKLHSISGKQKIPQVIFTAANRPPSVLEGQDYLPQCAAVGTQFLKEYSSEGFFLMIEGSQIDWAAHANEANNILLEMNNFSEAIYKMLDFVNRDQETLLIVTADHETGGMAIIDQKKRGKLKLAFTANDHTGTMVPVFAYGPGAELFEGIYDNTDIYHKMKAALFE